MQNVNILCLAPLTGIDPIALYDFSRRRGSFFSSSSFLYTSLNAFLRSFLFSDSNVECLSVDISMDLEQILGRQRLLENPWKNSAFMVIRTTKEARRMTQEHFNNILKQKNDKSYDLLEGYNNQTKDTVKTSIAEKYLIGAQVQHYKYDYVSVNRFIDSDGRTYLKPVFNNLAYVSEIRAFEVQQEDYKDRFTVMSVINGEGIDGIKDEVSEKAHEFNDLKDTVKKLKMLVDFTEGREEKDINNFFDLIPTKYREYYELLGPDRIRANSYQESKLKKEWRKIHMDDTLPDELVKEIHNIFDPSSPGYSNSEAKKVLKDLYNKYNYSRSAKTSDLEVFFYMKSIKLKDMTGNWINGFKIIAKK